MRELLFIILLGIPFALEAQADTTQKQVAGRRNSAGQQQKPYVILISADGFRYDFADKYNATHLQQLRTRGAAAAAMTPSYPTLTFPNHYTIVTGLYPAHHGLVDNFFYEPKRNLSYKMSSRQAVEDSSWYGGTPLWVLAEQQHMLTASFYWVGSEAPVQGIRPTYYYRYNDSIDMDTRIGIVRNWLTLPEDQRPHFIAFYMSQVDHEAHFYGPDSKQTEEAVHLIDETVAKMVRMTDSLKLPVNYIFLSDHGMVAVDTVHTMPLPRAVDTTQFMVPPSDLLLHLYAKDKKFIEPTYQALKKEAVDYDVYRKDKVPARLHYGAADDRYGRIGDILLVPKFPKIFRIKPGGRITPGKHGYDNALKNMQATFYAWGPGIRPNKKIPAFENIHVYPLVAALLGLQITGKTDGSFKVLKPILR